MGSEETQHLSWNFPQHFLSQVLRVPTNFSKWYELYNISGSFSALVIRECFFISVQLFHLVKLGRSHAYNDDRQRQIGRLHNEFLGICHIIDNSICEN